MEGWRQGEEGGLPASSAASGGMGVGRDTGGGQSSNHTFLLGLKLSKGETQAGDRVGKVCEPTKAGTGPKQ